MKFLKKIVLMVVLLATSLVNTFASSAQHSEDLNVKEFILEHISDSYEWHITAIGGHHISIPLPIIAYSQKTGWHFFLSSKFHESPVYENLTIAKEGELKGKLVEVNEHNSYVRPFDISITKIALSILFNSALLIVIVLVVARSYRKDGFGAKKGFVGFMEWFILSVRDDVIKPCVGKDYKKYSSYLLTLFFFIFLNNLMGLIPFFPGGANVTGNIAVTFVLAVVTLFIVNISGTKEYWKEIFWPEVPTWLKFPVPLLPVIEFIGIFSKVIALMLRLFANMLAGHALILALTCLIFVTVKLGVAANTSMTVLSVVFSVFISFVELLVAFIQAYIFTMLSAVFIGLAKVEHHNH